MKGFIICKNYEEVEFSYEFKERWLQWSNPDEHYSYEKITWNTFVPVDDAVALELFERMGAEWSAVDGHELEMYEVPEKIISFVSVEPYKYDGQKLVIDWKDAAIYISEIGTKNERLAFTKELVEYDKFLSEEFP
jgi:hypothetical protein